MSGTYEFVIDGNTIETGEKFARGPIVESNPKRWIKQDVLGEASPPTILTKVGESSQEWDFESRAKEATKVILQGVYDNELPVLLKTPQNSTGFNVVMTKFFVEYKTPLHGSLYLCKFTLVRR